MKNLITKTALFVVVAVGSATAAQAQVSYSFGFAFNLVSNGQQKGLLVQHITHGGPACRAGLKVGDVVLRSNNVDFNQAADDNQARYYLNASVDRANGGFPTAASARPKAHLDVMRHGQTIRICIYPDRVVTNPTPITHPEPIKWFPVTPDPWNPGRKCSGGGGGGISTH